MDPLVDALPARGRGRLSATMPTNSSLPNPNSTIINGTGPTSGPWRPRTEPQNAPRELRRPRETPQGLPTNTPVSEKDIPGDTPATEPPATVNIVEDVSVTKDSKSLEEDVPTFSASSKLSAEAKVFVPRFRTTIPAPNTVKEFVPRSRSSVGSPHNVKEFVPRNRTPVDDLAGISKQYRQHHSNEGYQPDWSRGGEVDVTPEEVAMNHLTEVMTHMTLNPGAFDALVKPLLDAFGSWLQDEETVVAIVDSLFEQSVSDANFRFNGARLCHALNNKFGSQFRTLLLNRCRQEHNCVTELLLTLPSRAHGYLLFVADLFVTLEVVKGSRQKIAVLGKAVLETIDRVLLSPTHDNVKCVCQSFKLSGYHLNELEPAHVDAVFTRLRAIHVDHATATPTQVLVLNLTNLRRENWGVSTTAQAGAAAAPTTAAQPPPNGPTFYGPDGLVLTQEESQFLQENVTSSSDPDDSDPFMDLSFWEQDDGMNEEVEAAFEQFLLLGKKATSR